MFSFRAGLRSGRTQVGTMLTLPTPEVAEMLSGLDFDWLFIDCEHGVFSIRDVQSILQACRPDTDCLVRIAENTRGRIQAVLDLGAGGLIAPQVNSAEEAADVVLYARYQPQGSRGVGLARAHGYGARFGEYLAGANDSVAVIVQAEHRRAVESIEQIVRVPGVDAVLIGPYDLSASYGKPGQLDDPQIVDAVARIEACCRSQQIPVGIFGVTAEAVQPYIDRGFEFVCVGVDAQLLMAGASGTLKQVRRGQRAT